VPMGTMGFMINNYLVLSYFHERLITMVTVFHSYDS
jgi:hypothetical protein